MGYREPEPTVRVELGPTPLRLRVRTELRGGAYGTKALWGLPAATGLTLLAEWSYRESAGIVIAFFTTTFLVFFLVRAVPEFVGALFRALAASPLDRGLPRAFVFRASGIRIEPTEAEPYERRWPYFQGARRAIGGIELVLSHAPYQLCLVRRRALRPKEYELLRTWLTDAGLFPRR